MKNILIIDDDLIIREILSGTLSADYNITLKESSETAFDFLLNNYLNIDLLIVDYHMPPNMNGIELLEKLKENQIQIPAILFTSDQDRKLILKAWKFGCIDFLDKDAGTVEIKKTIEKCLNKIEEEKNEINLEEEIVSYQHQLKKYQEQVESAKISYHQLISIDESLLKQHEIAYQYQALFDLGGDFFDVSTTDKGYDIFLSDVAGHDLGASYHSILLKSFFKENQNKKHSGRAFFNILNSQLYDNGKNQRMVTGAFISIDLDKMKYSITSAAHPPLIHYSKSRNELIYKDNHSSPLGLFKESEYSEMVYDIEKGDVLILYTDGLMNLERMNNNPDTKAKLTKEEFNEMLLNHLDRNIDEFINLCWNDLMNFSHYKLKDDVVLIGTRI